MPPREQSVLEFAETIPRRFRRAYQRAAGGTASPRAASKAPCLACVAYEDAVLRI